MKRVSLALFLFISLSSFSQDFVQTKSGYAFTGDGDLSGINFEAEYLKTLNRLSVGIGASYCNFPYRQKDEAILRNSYTYFSNSKTLYGSIYLDVFSINKSIFRIGLKPGLRYWRNTHITGPDIEYGNLVPESCTYQDELYTFSYAFNINYMLNITNNFGVLANAELSDDLSGANLLSLNIGAFFKLN